MKTCAESLDVLTASQTISKDTNCVLVYTRCVFWKDNVLLAHFVRLLKHRCLLFYSIISGREIIMCAARLVSVTSQNYSNFFLSILFSLYLILVGTSWLIDPPLSRIHAAVNDGNIKKVRVVTTSEPRTCFLILLASCKETQVVVVPVGKGAYIHHNNNISPNYMFSNAHLMKYWNIQQFSVSHRP